MLNRETTYTYTPIDGSDEKVGELLTGIITEVDLQGVDPTDHEQTAEVAVMLEDFGSHRSIAEEPLELARMVIANRVYGWLPPKDDMFTEWETAHKGYIELNNGQPTPVVALAVRERHPYYEKPYGYYMSISEADAMMLNFLRLRGRSSHSFATHLGLDYEGYGTLFFDHNRQWPSALGDLTAPLPYMLLRSGEEQQPLTIEARERFEPTILRSTLHFALGKKAVLAIPDHLKATGRFTDETLLEEMGRMGIPVRHTELHANHYYDDNTRMEKTEELRQSIIKSLLFMATFPMPKDIRSQVTLYDIDIAQLAETVERDFGVIDSTLPSLRKDNAASFHKKTGHSRYKLPDDDCLNGIAVGLAAWRRDTDGYDKELVEYALAMGELF